ncbi:MAG: ABC transporter ATP-binding protein [Clostridiales bacterium]|nr:ABC transporter ATP-binding protein [Candidatus Crickella caballi]
MISVSDLRYAYGTHEVLKGVSFDARPGELLCILGHNGAGKSTLFKCMLGLLKGYSGSITVDGIDFSRLKPKEKALYVAYIPQASKPTFAYNVMDMVIMGTMSVAGGMSGPGEKEKRLALDALSKMGIMHLKDRDYTKISGGEQQMVLIARALAQGAKILIMDEPTSSLDYGNQMRVQKQLRKLVSEGYTIIQSTHNPEQTYVFADRILCIRDGIIYRQGKPQDVMDEKLIKDMYGIDVEMVESADKRVRFFELKEYEDNEENKE